MEFHVDRDATGIDVIEGQRFEDFNNRRVLGGFFGVEVTVVIWISVAGSVDAIFFVIIFDVCRSPFLNAFFP